MNIAFDQGIEASTTIVISTVAQQGDDLAVGGTIDSDAISLQAGADTTVVVDVNGQIFGPFHVPGKIYGYGLDGSDKFDVFVTGSGGLEIDGQGGADTYAFYFGNLARTVTVWDTGSGDDADELLAYGTAAADFIDKKQAGEIHWGKPVAETILYSGIDKIAIYGGGGSDKIRDPANVDTRIFRGEGDDEIIIDGVGSGSSVTVDGGPGNDHVIVEFGSIFH